MKFFSQTPSFLLNASNESIDGVFFESMTKPILHQIYILNLHSIHSLLKIQLIAHIQHPAAEFFTSLYHWFVFHCTCLDLFVFEFDFIGHQGGFYDRTRQRLVVDSKSFFFPAGDDIRNLEMACVGTVELVFPIPELIMQTQRIELFLGSFLNKLLVHK